MRLYAIAAALAAVVSSVNAAIPEADFNALKWAAGVGWAYSENGCSLPAIKDRGGKTWKNLFTVTIKDGGGGNIIVRIFQRPDIKEVYLFFPGTKDNSNWVTNLDATLVDYNNALCKGGCKVHRGFLNAWNNGKGQIIPSLQYIKNVLSDHTLVISGGSLGGALASLAYAEFMSDWSLNLIPSRGVSFGQPRVGNAAWASFMNGLTGAGQTPPKWQRVTHSWDSIPRAPPPQGGYQHFATEFWMKDNAFQGNRPTYTTTDVCLNGAGGAEPANCVNSGPGGGNIGDHTTYAGYGSEAAECKAP